SDDRGTPFGKRRKQRQVPLRVSSAADGKQHDARRVLSFEQCYVERLWPILDRDFRHTAALSQVPRVQQGSPLSQGERIQICWNVLEFSDGNSFRICALIVGRQYRGRLSVCCYRR
ncbi:MAG TPA: hypothetical protein VKP30_26065, partial [Polyangiaceae bacterium]|nr:hypothetical protein [Polyangiaceae bacterium]